MTKKTASILCAVVSIAMPGLVLAVSNDARPQSPNGRMLIAQPSASAAPFSGPRSQPYTVQRGDTAGKIARMQRVSLNDLILANDLDRRATGRADR